MTPLPATQIPKWKQLIQNSVTSFNDLLEAGTDPDDPGEVDKLPLRITREYLETALKNPKLLKTVIPSINELIISDGESIDPLEEDLYRKTKCVIHKYHNRVLFLVTKFCSTNCRFCTRSRLVGGEIPIFKKDWIEGIEYIKHHPEINDVLISGGDPLTLSDNSLEFILSELKAIPHIDILRIGTKVPVVLPDRITDELVEILKRFHPLLMSIHFTHPAEITDKVKIALKKLADAGIPLGSQTVLLKDINDDFETLKDLFSELLKNRVKPYYLYQCDNILGSAHFKSTKEKGIEIINKLRKSITGYAIPTFVIDSPEMKLPIC